MMTNLFGSVNFYLLKTKIKISFINSDLAAFDSVHLTYRTMEKGVKYRIIIDRWLSRTPAYHINTKFIRKMDMKNGQLSVWIHHNIWYTNFQNVLKFIYLIIVPSRNVCM